MMLAFSRHTAVALPSGLGSPCQSYTSQHEAWAHERRCAKVRQRSLRVEAAWQNKTGSNKQKATPGPAPKQGVSNSNDYNFELPELPSLDDIRADRVIRGSLVGTFVGTILSAAVSPIQYVLAAAAVASGVSLVPNFDTEELKDAADSKGAELPGEALGTAVSKGKDIVEGSKAEGSAATVLAAALVAGSTVSLFAAKSLPLVFGGSAVYVAAQADDSLNLTASTLRGRDFLRSRKEAGVGILFSLIALQARRAADAVTAWSENQPKIKPATLAYADGHLTNSGSQAKVRSPSLQSSASGSTEAAKKQSPGILTKAQIEAMQDEAERTGLGPLTPVTSSLRAPLEALSKSLAVKTPPTQLQGSPDDSENAVTTAQPIVSPKPFSVPSSNGNGNGSKPSPTSFEPSLSDSILNSKSPSSSSQFQPSLQDRIVQSGVSASTDKESSASPTPLEKQKGGNRDVGAGDLATGPPEKKEIKPLLQPDSPATKTPDSGSPLEKQKGGNRDVGAGDLATGPPEKKEIKPLLQPDSPATKTPGSESPLEKLKGTPVREEDLPPLSTKKPVSINKEADSLLQKGSPATQSPGPGTPLENLKGGNSDVKAGDLTTGKPDVADKTDEAKLTSSSPATQKPQGPATPLENLKGGNKNIKAGDLTTGTPEVVDKTDQAKLTKDSPATEKPPGPKTPLENVKGGNRDIKAGDLTTGKTDFSQSKEGILRSGSPATQTPGKETPLENLKGGNRDVKAGDLTTGKTTFVPREDKALLKPDSPATKIDPSPPQADVSKIGSGSPSSLAPGQSTPLENVKGGNRDVGVGDLATGPSNFKAAAQQPVLEGTSPMASAQATSPLDSLKGGTTSKGASDDQQTFYSSGQKANQDNNLLLLQSSTGLGKALSLQSLKPKTSPSQASGNMEKQDLLDSLAGKANEAGEGLTAPTKPGSSAQSSAASSSVESIVSKPYEIGKTALEQALPATQAQPQKRSASGPSEISKLARNAPPALVRPPADVSNIKGLSKPDSGNVPALAPRAAVSGRPAAPPKKKTFISSLLVLAGSGILGGLLGIVYYLVNGQTIGHQIPRTLLTVVFCCIAVVILLVSLGKRESTVQTAVGAV